VGETGKEKASVILDRFVEGLFRMMLDHHRAHVAEMELTLAQAQALMLLRAEAASTTGLASSLGISAPAVTQLTDRLVRKRLIERRPVEGDRRSVAVALTAEGRRVVDTFRRRRGEVFARALDRLSGEQRAEVIQALDKIAAVLDTSEASELAHPSKKTVERVVSIEVESTRARTPVEPAEASNKVRKAPVGQPVKRKRMRIEWD
jgi:DNA-binding MarR family transcriptional regulator